MAVAYPLWKNVYDKAVGQYGEQKAVRMADEAVTRTLGSGSVLDQAAAQRGSEFQKILSMYYSWCSMMFNRAWLSGKIAGLEYTKENRAKAAAVAAHAAFLLFVLPAISDTLISEFLRNRQSDDPDARKKRIWAGILKQPFGYLWLVRDVSGPAIDTLFGRRGEIKIPLQSAAEDIVYPLMKGVRLALEDRQFDAKAFAESASRGAAIVFGYPQQLNTWVFNFIDWLTDEGEPTWRDFISRRTKN